jgi:multidrug efflux pump
VTVLVDRDAAQRLGVSMASISAVLNNSFSQRQISVMYGARNQYRVVMGVAPRYAQDPD